MSTNKFTLQSGIVLVSLSSEVTGGVVYSRKDLDERCGADGVDAMGAPAKCKRLAKHEPPCDFSPMTAEEVTRWETTRTIADKAEHEKATKVRNKARSLITAVCCNSNFGLLCLATKEADLNAAYAEARAMVEAFNAAAKYTRVEIYMMIGEIRESSSSVQSISAEVVGLIDKMISGIADGDEDAVRDAANKLTQLSDMLDDASRATITKAIADARSAARAIVKAKEEREESGALGAATLAAQKEAARTAAAQQTLQQARTALDVSSDVMARIEAAAAKQQHAS